VVLVSTLWILTGAQKKLHGTDPLAGMPAAGGHSEMSMYKMNQSTVLELYGKELYFFPPVEIKVSWHDAKRSCESHGLNVVFLETPEEYDWLTLALFDHKRQNNEHWTSGKKDGKWIWDVTHDDIRDMVWSPGYTGKEDCLALWAYNGYQTKVLDKSCKSLYSFICKLV